MRQNPEHDAPCLRRGRSFNDPGSIPVGFGEVFYTVAGRCNSSHRLLDLGEKGVYPSYNSTPEDIAPAATFITSEEAGWITGQILSVNGGVS
jgi:NAD(P)-dependent dehydrogenase (short-subunit alcohol dehydrogenase family)